MSSVSFTSEFHQAFQRQTTRLLRGRFVWFTGIYGMVSGVWFAGLLIRYIGLSRMVSESAANASAGSAVSAYVSFAQHGFDLLLYGLACLYGWRWPISDARLVKLSAGVILFDGFGTLLLDAASGQWGGLSIWGLFLPHVLAAVFLPWTWWESIRPMLPVLAFNALLCLAAGWLPGTSDWEIGWRLFAFLASLLVPLPGMVAAMIRHDSRFRRSWMEHLETSNRQVRRELADARKIHESLFPRAEARGSVKFAYAYQPMIGVGGDYLYARFDHSKSSDEPALTLLLMDVTGHGFAAALTVNRLYGEVERLFGENPEIMPGEVIRALNRYVYHTLANHALYVTAACVRIDPATEHVLYASAGHPPAFLRAVDGTIDQLDSTTFLLGAVRDDEFDSPQRTLPFVRGDTLLMYTDGAMEAADEQGRQFGIEGLQRAIASCGHMSAGDWPGMILTAVDRHRDGKSMDDTLVVELSRLIVPAQGLSPGEQKVTVIHNPR